MKKKCVFPSGQLNSKFKGVGTIVCCFNIQNVTKTVLKYAAADSWCILLGTLQTSVNDDQNTDRYLCSIQFGNLVKTSILNMMTYNVLHMY